jgi:beta-glucosidase-like glycosyl hydrolase
MGAENALKIPLLYGIDAVHGHNNVDGAVIFPHNIGLGATRNPALVEKAARVVGEEVAARAFSWAFAPCVAVARHEQWGRTYESFGESPELVAEMGAATFAVCKARQLSDSTSVLACAKHFLADGGTSNGVDQGNSICDEADVAANVSGALCRGRQGGRGFDHGVLQQLERRENARQQISSHRRAQGRTGVQRIFDFRLGGH